MSTYVERERNRRYDHPSSARAREEAKGEGSPDPIALLRGIHRQQLAELGEKHKSEVMHLRYNPRGSVEQQTTREREMLQRHHNERRALGERHAIEQTDAIRKTGR